MTASEQIKDVLEYLADKLQVPMEVLWSALLKQATLTGVAMMICSALAWVGGISLTWVVARRIRNADDYADNFPYVVAGILGLILTAMMGGIFWSGATAYFNPEYWAIQEILSLAKGCR